MTRILVTGATGFVGGHLLNCLGNYNLRLAGRSLPRSVPHDNSVEFIEFDLASTEDNFDQLLKNVDVIIHLAGIAHKNSVADSDYVLKNTVGTARLAEAAARMGIKRFIFLSTIKVHATPAAIYTAV